MSDERKLNSYEDVADYIGGTPDLRYQLYRRIKDAYGPFDRDTWWMYREATRFIRKEYEPLMPFDPEWYRQVTLQKGFIVSFPHISKKDPTLISWVPNLEYGFNDRRVTGKPGRMLTALFGKPENEVSALVNRYNSTVRNLELKFADTKEEIYRVYRNGPNSCMSKTYEPRSNPLAVYACKDLKIAYVVEKESIVARTIVRVDRDPPQYTRCYGNEFAIQRLLEGVGYTFSHDGLAGVTLGTPNVDVNNNRMYVAYLDGPHQHFMLRWADRSIRIVTSNTRPDGNNEILLAGTSGEGTILMDTHFMQAWVAGSMQLNKPTPRMRERFYGGANYNDDGEVECTECSDFYDTDSCQPTVTGHPVCEGCLDDNYVRAIVSITGTRAWVHAEADALVEVGCLNDYCYGINPEEVFPVVRDYRGELIYTDIALYSDLVEAYIHRDEAYLLNLLDEDGDEDRQIPVTDGYIDANMHLIVIMSDIRVRHDFRYKLYLLQEERTAHEYVEEIGQKVAQKIGAARRSILVERPQEFAQRIAESYLSTSEARARTELLSNLPSAVTSLIRSLCRELEQASGNAQSRTAAR